MEVLYYVLGGKLNHRVFCELFASGDALTSNLGLAEVELCKCHAHYGLRHS